MSEEFVIMCKEFNCPKVREDGTCPVYSPAGQMFRHNQGICPITNIGPKQKVVETIKKVRVGQQKQKKK